MLASASVITRGENVEDPHYDASEEESICEMETEKGAAKLEKAIAIVDAPQTEHRSVSEPIHKRKRLFSKHTLRPCPVLTGYSTSDEEMDGIAKPEKGGKKRLARRRASWPQPPLTPKAHDSGVQGLGDSASDSGNDFGDRIRLPQHPRKLTKPDVLYLVQVESEEEEESVVFKGIADADSSEERWRQIVLEEHMDKIFNAVPRLPGEEAVMETELKNDEVVVRASFETTDEWGIPRRKKTGWKEQVSIIMRLFGCMKMRKEGI